MNISSSLLATLLSSVIAAQATDRFRLDFDNSSPAPPDNTQSGWEAFSESGDTNNKSVAYSGYTGLAGGDITITTSGVSFTRNYDNGASGPPNFPGTDLDAVYNDLILRNNTAAPIDITIAGLSAGTYQITTFHLTGADAIVDVSEFDLLVQDADSPAFSQDEGNFSMGRGTLAVSPNVFIPTTPTFLVTSNGTDPVVVRIAGTSLGGGGTPGWFGINGLEVRVPPTGFQLDFDNGSPAPPGNTQSGWEAFSKSADPNNKTLSYPGYPLLASGDITITTSGVKFTRNYNNSGSAAPDFPGTDLDRVYNDLILVNTVGDIFDVSIAGLNAGTYQITTHHLTQGLTFPAGKSKFDLLVTDSDSPAFSQVVNNFTMGAGEGATFASPTLVPFNVVSNGTDPVILRFVMTEQNGGGQGAWVGVNGLEVTIPDTGYAAWTAGPFANPFTDTLPTDNPDGDSLSNLLEFAFGTDPTVSNGSSLEWTDPTFTTGTPVVSQNFPPGGGVDFKARFIRRVDHGSPGSVDYALRFSSDLTDWESSGAPSTPNWYDVNDLNVLATNGDYQLVEFPYPFQLDNNKKARFFQVEVTEVP